MSAKSRPAIRRATNTGMSFSSWGYGMDQSLRALPSRWIGNFFAPGPQERAVRTLVGAVKRRVSCPCVDLPLRGLMQAVLWQINLHTVTGSDGADLNVLVHNSEK
jgi:hypothetical protein